MGSGGVGFVACLGLSICITSLDATARPGLVLASFTLMDLAVAGLWLCVGRGYARATNTYRQADWNAFKGEK